MSLVEMQHSSINSFCMNLHRRQTQRSDSATLNHEGLLVLPACLLIKVNKSWQAPEAQLHCLKIFQRQHGISRVKSAVLVSLELHLLASVVSLSVNEKINLVMK